MPAASLKPCTHPGCPVLTTGGRCDTHRRQQRRQEDSLRPSFRERGYTSRWDAYSRDYRKANPLCRRCQQAGRLVPTECTDHIVPCKPDDPRFWDPSNHQPLCDTCHSIKTATEDGGFGNAGRGGRRL